MGYTEQVLQAADNYAIQAPANENTFSPPQSGLRIFLNNKTVDRVEVGPTSAFMPVDQQLAIVFRHPSVFVNFIDARKGAMKYFFVPNFEESDSVRSLRLWNSAVASLEISRSEKRVRQNIVTERVHPVGSNFPYPPLSKAPFRSISQLVNTLMEINLDLLSKPDNCGNAELEAVIMEWGPNLSMNSNFLSSEFYSVINKREVAEAYKPSNAGTLSFVLKKVTAHSLGIQEK